MTHWSEDPERSAAIDYVVDNLPPKTWDVVVWIGDNYVTGRLDAADRNALIDTVLQTRPPDKDPRDFPERPEVTINWESD